MRSRAEAHLSQLISRAMSLIAGFPAAVTIDAQMLEA
jgi:hypothetical protein